MLLFCTAENTLIEHDDHVEVNGVVFNKPFVEKPVSAEDHNIYMYYPTSAGELYLSVMRFIAALLIQFGSDILRYCKCNSIFQVVGANDFSGRSEVGAAFILRSLASARWARTSMKTSCPRTAPMLRSNAAVTKKNMLNT